MKLSRYFANLTSSYNAELDDLRTDSEGNTYQIRRLPDGSRHEVIKNFPTDSTMRKKLAQHARDIRIVRGQYFWILTCVLR